MVVCKTNGGQGKGQLAPDRLLVGDVVEDRSVIVRGFR